MSGLSAENIAISVEGLTKSFNGLKALDGIDLHVMSGSCHGLLGPNGAGKSTAMNIISTYLTPDSGVVLVDGLNTSNAPSEVRARLGVIPQEISVYDQMSAMENIMFFGGLYGIPTGKLKEKAAEILDLLGLAERSKEPVKRFSGGMKRRLNMGCSLAHDPAIILMDEPTVGIDPQSRNFIYEFIEGLSARGRTIIYTSHYMEEVERLCDRVSIIDNGKIIAEGTKEELIELVQGDDVVILELGELSQEAHRQISVTFPDKNPVFDNGSLRLTGTSIHRDVPSILSKLMDAGITPKSVHIKEPNLETVFLKLTGRELRD